MIEIQNPKQYDLKKRTYEFAKKVREFVKKLPRTISNIEDGKQVIRSSGSIGANYIEANEALSKKEAKETMHWLRMVAKANAEQSDICRKLYREVHELTLIFSTIVRNSKQGKQ